ncbi:hypothetical protein HMPREF1870_01624 [Bacteroidales bacterium KA00344]|nr:hypothetical protein HMPREF1870_01624 [Bacteroidales bacterium KA00344]
MQKNIKLVRFFLSFPVLLIMGCLSLCSCENDNEEQLTETVSSFSDSYFNWQYFRSVKYCTLDSKQWLSYMASQVNEADVEALRAQEEGATVEIEDVDLLPGDSVAKVRIIVYNYLNMDTIGVEGRVVDKAFFVIPAKRNNGVWKVQLTAPLRAVKD